MHKSLLSNLVVLKQSTGRPWHSARHSSRSLHLLLTNAASRGKSLGLSIANLGYEQFLPYSLPLNSAPGPLKGQTELHLTSDKKSVMGAPLGFCKEVAKLQVILPMLSAQKVISTLSGSEYLFHSVYVLIYLCSFSTNICIYFPVENLMHIQTNSFHSCYFYTIITLQFLRAKVVKSKNPLYLNGSRLHLLRIL